MRISSPMTQLEDHLDGPEQEGLEWKWYKSSCPCCRRPLDITVRTRVPEMEGIQSWQSGNYDETHKSSRSDSAADWGSIPVLASPRYAYACVMWGTNPGYALGVLLLDIDTFPLKSLHDLFDLEAPAAFAAWSNLGP
eukprot:Skav230583  [mRNA]  locus=scaffold1455:54693:59629:- [translate_table: standard]